MTALPSQRIRVLVVDDSAFARKVIREVLSRDAGIEVIGIARDGLEALEKAGELRPDVITLDLIMPELDGLGVLHVLGKDDDPPRVIVVSVSSAESEIAIEALDAGAVDLVTKPTPLPTDRLYELSNDLIFKVKAAAAARPRRPGQAGEAPATVLHSLLPNSATRLVVIGTSTGGPQALTRIFGALPAGLAAPIAVALHIPAGYTGPLAERISRGSAVRLMEARDGMRLAAGEAVIAPGGMHLRVRSEKGRFYAVVSREPLETVHHPSVDLLFESAAHAAGDGAMGIVLTGMGDDGLRGSRAIREARGLVLAESASSCVVYGMPRSVIEAGLASGEAPLEKMPELMLELLRRESASERTARPGG